MKNKQFEQKSLELIAFGEQLIVESKDKQETRELQAVIKVHRQALRSTGYRQLRPQSTTRPDANIFRDAKAKEDAKRNGMIIEEIKTRDNSHKGLEKAKGEFIKDLKKGKKERTNDKDKAEIKVLFQNNTPIPEISETLWIKEDVIYKVLGIGGGESKAVIADNSENDSLND